MANNKKVESKVAEYTDIVHELREGVVYDVYYNGNKEVKSEESHDQDEYREIATVVESKPAEDAGEGE